MNNEQLKFKLKNTTLTLALCKKIEYLDINVTKHIQDLYEKSYKTLMKYNKENLNKWRYSMFMDSKTQNWQDFSYSQFDL